MGIGNSNRELHVRFSDLSSICSIQYWSYMLTLDLGARSDFDYLTGG